jgi:hypothetical protein
MEPSTFALSSAVSLLKYHQDAMLSLSDLGGLITTIRKDLGELLGENN